MDNIKDELVEEQPLPQNVIWGDIEGRPKSLADISIRDANSLSEAITAVTDIEEWQSYLDGILDVQTAEIIAEWTFKASGALAISTNASNGIWLSPTGILAKKAGATTFAITTGGDASFGGSLLAGISISSPIISAGTITGATITGATISGGTITGAVVRTSSGTTRVEMTASDNTLKVYKSNVVRTELGEEYLILRDASNNRSGAIYGTGSSIISVMTGIGTGLFRFDNTTFKPGAGSLDLGSTSDRWNAIYGDYIRSYGTLRIDGWTNVATTLNNLTAIAVNHENRIAALEAA